MMPPPRHPSERGTPPSLRAKDQAIGGVGLRSVLKTGFFQGIGIARLRERPVQYSVRELSVSRAVGSVDCCFPWIRAAGYHHFLKSFSSPLLRNFLGICRLGHVGGTFGDGKRSTIQAYMYVPIGMFFYFYVFKVREAFPAVLCPQRGVIDTGHELQALPGVFFSCPPSGYCKLSSSSAPFLLPHETSKTPLWWRDLSKHLPIVCLLYCMGGGGGAGGW